MYSGFNLAVSKMLMLIFFEPIVLFQETYPIKILGEVHTHTKCAYNTAIKEKEMKAHGVRGL